MNTTFIQPKLTIGKPGDKYEVEANAMADKVVSKPQTTNSSFFNPTTNFIQKMEGQDEEVQQKPLAASITPLVQRQSEASDEENIQTKCTECEKEESVQKMEEEDVQTKSEGKTTASPKIESSLHGSKGRGSSLSKPVKSEMESGFGADFSQVNIHTDNNAIQMNKQLNAQAFTHGNDVYFNKGKYNPSSAKGKHLLAHELTHTIQQGAISKKNIQRKELLSTSNFMQSNTIQRAEDLEASRFSGNNLLERVFDGLTEIRQTKNRSGTHTRLIQESLVAQGYSVGVHGTDGIFGTDTDAAIREFQIDAGAVKLDGIVGPETMRLLDMLDHGSTSVTPIGPSPSPATGAVFSESPNETFAGYDASTAPDSLVVPVNERRRANVLINPAGTFPTYVSDTPAVATVTRIGDGIMVTGISHGTTKIEAREGATVLATLQISVKKQVTRSVAFHYVCDSPVPPLAPHCSNGIPSADEMRSLLNSVWHRQTNILFTNGGNTNVVAPGNLGSTVDDNGFGGGEMGVVTALGLGADFNVFRVLDLTSTACGSCNGALTNGNNSMIADVSCGDGLGLPHEAGHFLGVVHGDGFIMTPCTSGRVDQRVSKNMADKVNV